MKHYQADEFIQDEHNLYTVPENKAEVIDKKVSLLYDFCILAKYKREPDVRESAVRKLLEQYGTEQQMSSALHSVLVGDDTLNNVLRKRGLM